ncbi:PREDICTED: uncharacterized protein LOC104605915 [Nelumbo nucifera]|uniref:Uncharacterized protein LOC104605915 n=1 Tax=Nelumbo nucifera TaxID=4432 RepID=A0A1U8AS25_NELNU|nr:PREDICTED: uncharacterized protein LOC104605915 [Nelumbo nucifera]
MGKIKYNPICFVYRTHPQIDFLFSCLISLMLAVFPVAPPHSKPWDPAHTNQDSMWKCNGCGSSGLYKRILQELLAQKKKNLLQPIKRIQSWKFCMQTGLPPSRTCDREYKEISDGDVLGEEASRSEKPFVTSIIRNSTLASMFLFMFSNE